MSAPQRYTLGSYHDLVAQANSAIDLEVEVTRLKGGMASTYAERDRLVCALSKQFPSWIERHPDADTTWDNDWRWIVFIALPTGQASWHIHDSELVWFGHLEVRDGKNSWDGHTTEEKYKRLDALTERWSYLQDLIPNLDAVTGGAR